jgi:hypothetical protein
MRRIAARRGWLNALILFSVPLERSVLVDIALPCLGLITAEKSIVNAQLDIVFKNRASS